MARVRNPVDDMSEAECALALVQLGFEIVDQKTGKPATREELEAAVKAEKAKKANKPKGR